MGFFGEEVSGGRVEVDVPEEYSLQLLQACLPPGDCDDEEEGEVITLFVQTSNEDMAFALCSLGGTKQNMVRFCSLQHEFGPEDSPLILHTSGGRMHLTGSWKWKSYADYVDSENENFVDCVGRDVESSSAPVNDLDGSQDLSLQNEKSHKRKHTETQNSQLDVDSCHLEKKTTRGKRGGKKEAPVIPASELVVVSKPPTSESRLKAWKIKPQNNEGILVPEPKQKTMKTGVLITDYVVGNGPEPKLGSTVKITYEGMFPDGKVFDKNPSRKKPLKFRVGAGQVIRGLDLGMDKMRVGGSREIVIPPALGYGKDGVGEIPGNQVLVFRVTLIGNDKRMLSRK